MTFVLLTHNGHATTAAMKFRRAPFGDAVDDI